ncbi:Pentatricopeptide repeat-containing protein [Platanthera guangdongensis]|uniref:Pentatricopeptide repeat-containing protein n=1 Tax=Platanthera guangdongensis TaxID=2320717 RepID=A0ABR2MFP6_9ASPA
MRLLPSPRAALQLQLRTLLLRRLTSSANSPAVCLDSLECGRLLQSLTNSRSYTKGQQLHSHILVSGVLMENTYLATKLCAFYSICSKMEEARVIFNGILLKNCFLWNVMIRGFSRSGFPFDALFFYREMLGTGRTADNFTFPFLLLACGDLLLDVAGKTIHSGVIVSGYEEDVYVGNSLLAMYSKFGEMVPAQKVFDKMLNRDITSWNTIVSSYVFDGNPKRGLGIFADMIQAGFDCDQASFLGALTACSDLGALMRGKEIHARILRIGIEFNNFLLNSLIDVYVNSDFVTGARKLFEMMSMRDTVSWNAMISGCARHGNAFGSLFLFLQMNSEGICLDLVTFLAALGGCNQLSTLNFGKNIHSHIIKLGFGHNVSIGTALVDMYAKCGALASSRLVFDEMPQKNLLSWSAMVSAYGLHGRGEEAVSVLNQMKEKRVTPDKVIFTSVLSACSHSGLVGIGREIFLQMQQNHGISPSLEHYSSMVDLLGRAGRLDEAYELILGMTVTPNVDVWAALLSSCQIHHNVKLAETAARHAFDLRPRGFGVYNSLSNVYAGAKRWEDVGKVRDLARRNGLRKPPGCTIQVPFRR